MTAITPVEISADGVSAGLFCICASAALTVTGSTAVSRTVTSAPMISQYQDVTRVSAARPALHLHRSDAQTKHGRRDERISGDGRDELAGTHRTARGEPGHECAQRDKGHHQRGQQSQNDLEDAENH